MRIRLGFIAWLLMLAACASDTPSSPEPVTGPPVGNEPAGNDPVTGPGPIVTATSNLALSADSICLRSLLGGIDPRDDDVRITSVTGSELPGLVAAIEYGPGQPTGWLTTTFTQTSTPARLWLHATNGTVPYGAWWADVTVGAPGGGTPRVIRVHFNLLNDTGVVLVIEPTVNLTFDLSPGYGRVTGYGIDCDFTPNSTCYQRYPHGTVLTLTAVPDISSAFVFWQTPPCALFNSPECTVTLNGLDTVYVSFALQGYFFALAVEGTGASGDVDAFGSPSIFIDNCDLVEGAQSGICGGYQSYGARAVLLEARPRSGSIFVAWGGDCTGNTTGRCQLAPRPGGSYSVTATFAKQ